MRYLFYDCPGSPIGDRRSFHLFLLLVTIVILVLVNTSPAFCDGISGSMVVGEHKFLVDGSISWEQRDILINLTVRRGKDTIGRLEIHMGESDNYFTFNGSRYPLGNDHARIWRQQLDSEFRAVLGLHRFTRTEKGGAIIYDSTELIEIRDSLPGKLRLTYRLLGGKTEGKIDGGKKNEKLAGIRFFSLPDWNNCFHDYVSLSLDFLET